MFEEVTFCYAATQNYWDNKAIKFETIFHFAKMCWKHLGLIQEAFLFKLISVVNDEIGPSAPRYVQTKFLSASLAC